MSNLNITDFQNFTVNYDNENKSVNFSWFSITLLFLCIFSVVILHSAVVYYVIKRKKLNELRLRLVPLYHFDPGECDDWEEELLYEPKFHQTVNHSTSLTDNK